MQSIEDYIYNRLRYLLYKDNPRRLRTPAEAKELRENYRVFYRAMSGKERNKDLDSYVRTLGFRDAPPELVAAKRELLKLKRALKCATVKS